ncbi:hypothetical protein [Brumimicrobium aurantiacum]|uniref:Uncharacterized protein n=1 Tax=Brumimicrobium aurantiacum TaxID=1737063 RepID=A0A3E1EZH8_9FLAO|nr:hypothetical protein [Brumimicrobium aurantiacum]RFC54958.1 hypothetical protein DXU93_03820 [Brumimicrobium aurantiacum]
MNKKEALEKEINELTNKLRDEKPAVYEHLMESPQTIPNDQDEESDDFIKALKEYKEQLLNLLGDDNK